MEYNLKDIYGKFDTESEISAYGNGHINDTYLCGKGGEYIMQRINTNVFENPRELMENIYNVTEFLKKKITEAGGDPLRETLSIVPTRNGEIFYCADEKNCFRMYKFIGNTVTHETVSDPRELYEAGRAFGKFQRMLDDYPAEGLHETIKDFHNTPARFAQLKTAVKNNAANRLGSVEAETEFAYRCEKYASVITDAIADGAVPIRVTHNDTKLNNVLFDASSGKGICVIDLDTVMPGSMLWDFGDALRFGASSGREDETDLDKIFFDLEKYEAFTKGFLSETAGVITHGEAELLAESALVMTYECGMRFLTDYLNGDTYFKVGYAEHNLDRARTQFKLVRDIERKLDEMKRIAKKYSA